MCKGLRRDCHLVARREHLRFHVRIGHGLDEIGVDAAGRDQRDAQFVPGLLPQPWRRRPSTISLSPGWASLRRSVGSGGSQRMAGSLRSRRKRWSAGFCPPSAHSGKNHRRPLAHIGHSRS
jgi:hypothetical protein